MRPKGIILIEGADASGKTTLARHLVETYGARRMHGRIWSNMWRWHVGMLRRAVRLADDGLVVLDRHWLSELVYGQVYRGGPSYDLGARCVDRVLQRAGAVTVLCAPADQEAQLAVHAKRAARGGEGFADVREVVALYADLRAGNVARPGDGYLGQLIRFGDFARRPDVMVYDVDRDGADLAGYARKVLARLRKVRAGQFPPALLSAHQNVVGGAAAARYLVVGEGASPAAEAVYWPWCARDGHDAATYLNRALHALAFDETRALWTNAVDEDDLLPDLLRLDKEVIALGVVAARRVRQLGHEVKATLPHPQFWRRFYHHDLAGYVDRLREALR